MSNRYIKYIITFTVGIIMAYAVFSYKNIFGASDTSYIVRILSDGFLVPAVIIGGIGILLLVSNGGMFDIFIYSSRLIRETFKRKENRDTNFPKTYFDFKQQRDKEYSIAHFLVAGGVFLLLSIVFNVLFYYV
ncbi:DUF3899 domain-containing protein [Proteiniborus sp. MB09-C3]|uniref:DUF3899 domain-containing protein n=1 Tax=Proteiniborus sp. MB09-C3 TaxID=3050072 RepID=UPI002554D1FF|nr:DUF3899 domain-containing protein [Proteiniborus sp. MB09-C3]WIV11697.1 DUF3899 domain-containing protein [Proteiniborus sp. MB09-C3]